MRAVSSPPPGVLEFRFPHLAGVRCLFSGAGAGSFVPAGSSEQEKTTLPERRKTLMHYCGASRWAELEQVHGTDLCLPAVAVGGESDPCLPRADGHATEETGLALCIKTADCQPVLLAECTGKFVAALHVGWRGNAAEYIQHAVARLCAFYGSAPARLLAVRGPSLGPGYAEFIHFAKEWPAHFQPWYNKATRTMNLWALTRSQLMAAGLERDAIFGIDMCTYALHPHFYSHRRGDAGRQVSIICLGKEGMAEE